MQLKFPDNPFKIKTPLLNDVATIFYTGMGSVNPVEFNSILTVRMNHKIQRNIRHNRDKKSCILREECKSEDSIWTTAYYIISYRYYLKALLYKKYNVIWLKLSLSRDESPPSERTLMCRNVVMFFRFFAG